MRQNESPKWMNLTVGAIGLMIVLSALATGTASVTLAERPAWLVLGFECVALSAGVLGVLYARGHFRDAAGLALASMAGSVAVAAFLGWLSVQGRLQVKGTDVPISLAPLLAGRLGCAGLIGLFGAGIVLTRHPQSTRYLITSIATGAALAGLLGVLFVARARIISASESLPGVLSAAVATLVGLGAVILLSASVHCLIRAFELGREDAAGAPSGQG